jgi:hypothetical protein
MSWKLNIYISLRIHELEAQRIHFTKSSKTLAVEELASSMYYGCPTMLSPPSPHEPELQCAKTPPGRTLTGACHRAAHSQVLAWPRPCWTLSPCLVAPSLDPSITPCRCSPSYAFAGPCHHTLASAHHTGGLRCAVRVGLAYKTSTVMRTIRSLFS